MYNAGMYYHRREVLQRKNGAWAIQAWFFAHNKKTHIKLMMESMELLSSVT